MKTSIFIFILFLFSTSLTAQKYQYTYFKLEKEIDGNRVNLYPKNLPHPLKVTSTTHWRMSGFTDLDEKGLKKVVLNRMREAFSNCPEDEYEIIRTSSYLFYVDADFKLVTFISNIDVENLETFHKVEKKYMNSPVPLMTWDLSGNMWNYPRNFMEAS